MSKIISFGNLKGGVGKSQCTILTATALSNEPFKFNICVLDTDPQQSITTTRKLDLRAYNQTTAPYKVLSLSVERAMRELPELDHEFDFIFIDAQGKLDTEKEIKNQEIGKLLMLVDFLFVPLVQGNFNLAASSQYIEFAKRIEQVRSNTQRPINIYSFINLAKPRSKANGYLLQDAQALNVQIMQNALNDYSLFREADTISTIYSSGTDAAKKNFTTWLNELLSLVQ